MSDEQIVNKIEFFKKLTFTDAVEIGYEVSSFAEKEIIASTDDFRLVSYSAVVEDGMIYRLKDSVNIE